MAQSQDQIKAKYQNVLNTIQQANGSLKNVNMEGDKLLIRAEVANEDLKNKVWEAIKQVDSSYSDLHADIIVNSSLQAPVQAAAANSTSGGGQTYTVQAGDSLSKIAEKFYGKASEYNKIFEANRDKMTDADHVKAGTTLNIPA
jgi:LysM repeat protein